MAVYTRVSDDELAAFLKSYDLGEVRQFSGITAGVENSNYRLTTEGGDYILTLFEGRTAESDLPFFIDLMTHIDGAGLSCPKPVAGGDGVVLRRLCGKDAAIVTFLQGASYRFPSPEQCYSAGAMLAKMHKAAADFPKTHANAFGYQSWKKMANDIKEDVMGRKRTYSRKDMLDSLIQSHLKFFAKSWPQNLPHGVIHGDFFPDNVFFSGDKVTGVIDFYFACNDALAYDLSIAINAWCFDEGVVFNPDKSAAMLAGYQSQRPLSDAEFNALPILCGGSAARFLLTRLFDEKNTPADAQVVPHNPAEYWQRLKYHLEITNPSYYGARHGG